jgi:hypothetical protein
MTPEEKQEIYEAFKDAVNMAPKELEEWLERPPSKGVGWKRDESEESVGHASGRRIVAIKRTKKAELDESDYAHMRKVVGYVRRHRAQWPSGDVEHTPWRYSLMNWGHDPLK